MAEKRKAKKYGNEFKKDSINYYNLNHPNLTLTQIGKNLGIPISTLRGWLDKDIKSNSKKSKNTKKVKKSKRLKSIEDLQLDIKNLRLDLKKVIEEKRILKKTLLIFMND